MSKTHSGFFKIRGTCLGVPIIRIIVFCLGGPLILGNYHLGVAQWKDKIAVLILLQLLLVVSQPFSSSAITTFLGKVHFGWFDPGRVFQGSSMVAPPKALGL